MDTTPLLSEAQLADFRRDGWLVLRQVLSPARVAELRVWVDQVARWAETDGPGLHHFEQTDAGPRIARSEDLVPHHAGLRHFICDDALTVWLGQLFGEPSVLFKEKINYKHPGGGGFAYHQDAPAYRFVDHHISCMVPLDPATEASGCLYVAPGYEQGRMPTDHRNCIETSFAETLDWRPVEVFPGDVLIFDSYTPHHSMTNRTDQPRRAMYLTYNALSKGDHRTTYYADKKAEFESQGGTFDGERVRISINDDFLGKPVAAPPRKTWPLEDLLDRFEGPLAHQLYDEAVTELSHGLQSAELAAAEGAPDALIAAALLHDVGHLLVGDLFPIEHTLERDYRHEEVAERYLARWFGPEVTRPIALHVQAKRYLVATDPDYAAGLSPSSIRSLQIQGGAMSAQELASFRADPHWEQAVRLRLWDDLAKDGNAKTRPFQAFHELLRGLATTH
jgi:predicted HD phosphohydrolase/ectoine hydroxylase-related dioxygenase (phytanoyl-CoA dioxygenase family)